MKVKERLQLTFGDIRPYISNTDPIQLILTSLEGDVAASWPCKDLMPEKYNMMPLIGFSSIDTIYLPNYDMLMRGIEVYLDDTGFPTEDDSFIETFNILLSKKQKRILEAASETTGLSCGKVIEKLLTPLLNDEEE